MSKSKTDLPQATTSHEDTKAEDGENLILELDLAFSGDVDGQDLALDKDDREDPGKADSVTRKDLGTGYEAAQDLGDDDEFDDDELDDDDLDEDELQFGKQKKQLPVLPLRNAVLYPGALMPLAIGRPKTLKLLNTVGTGGTVGVVSQKEKDTDNPRTEDVYSIGTLATIQRVHHEDENTLLVVVQGLERIRINEFVQESPYLVANVTVSQAEDRDTVEIQALMRSLKEMAVEIIELIPELSSGAAELISHIESPSRLAYLVMTHLAVPIEEKQAILEEEDVEIVLRKTLSVLSQQLEVLRVSQRINSEVKGEMNKSQREFFLRQQLKAIRKELGEDEEEEDFVEQLRERLLEAELPDEAQKAANRELKRLHSIQPSSPEYTVSRTYLEWMADLPWNTQTKDSRDITKAREILESGHFGLDKVKKRILEFLAVNALRSDGKSPILCLVGPPGVGKTSLGRSVAEALGRKYQRIALGGVRDEAEIRGHRRTYIGAMPGKFIQVIKRAGSHNPLLILDEIDKVGRDWRGDPTSALLEVLDPEQNNTFMDHYLDVPFDLSKVMFIATANQVDGIPRPLLDRMELIEIPGYTLHEKKEIARRHLLPKLKEEHGFDDSHIEFEDEAIEKVIVSYTREAGVRGLERQLASIFRGVAVGLVERKWDRRLIDVDSVIEFLGPEIFIHDAAERTQQPGISTGMAWTAAGGDILFIEATKMPGSGKLRLTGSLGDVMKESAELALSFLKANAAEYGVEQKLFKENDVHLHVPQGAIPKDGPSAGVTMFTALASLLMDKKVRGDLAMTGEITLRGNVLPVGGIKDKVLAAHRSGIKHIILPERNKKDLPDIPASIQEELSIHFVSRIQEVLELALEKEEEN